MKKILVLAFSFFSIFAGISYADSITNDNYWIVEAQQVTFGDDATFPGEEVSMPSFNFAFGHRFNRFVSAEANISWWIVNHHIASAELDSGTDVVLDKAQGLSLRLDFPIHNKISGFSQLSYNFVHLDVVGAGNQHDDGVGYSAGLEYDFKQGAVFLRYAMVLDNENDDPSDLMFEDLTSVGLGYKLDLVF